MGKEKKIRIPLWIYPSTEEKLQKNYEADNCKSPSEFIEKAILFYCGYLSSEEYNQYLPNVVVSTMQGSLDAFEDRMATLLFKNSGGTLHGASCHGGDQSDRYGYALPPSGTMRREIKRLRGAVRLEDAVKFQNGDE